MPQRLEQTGDSAGFLEKAKRFLFHDLWVVELSSLSRLRGSAVRLLRISHLVIKGFREDNLLLHASALTFSTLMALVPLLAIALSMSKGLGAGDQLIREVHDFAAAMPQEFQDFVDGIITQVSSTNFIAVSGVSGLVLLAMVLQVLSSIEASFNLVWGVKTARSLLRKSAYYISTIVVVPILILASGTLTAGFEPLIQRLGGASVYAALLKLSPLLATWLAFSFLYAYMPNTRVHARAAFLSGLVGALLWLGWLRFYVTVQPGVGNYNVIYGALASVPIFLAWLFMSWVIVLLGAELSFAIQNESTYHLERAAPRASVQSKLLLALAITARAAEALDGKGEAFEARAFAGERGVAIRLVNEIVGLLTQAGLLAQVADGEDRYVLLRAPERVKVTDVIDIVLKDGSQPEELGLDHLHGGIKAVLDKVDQSVDAAAAELSIRHLLPDEPSP